jgi:hypothetical protein
MTTSTKSTISDGQDRIFICCRKVDDYEAFFGMASESDHDAFPAMKQTCDYLRKRSEKLNARLEQIDQNLQDTVNEEDLCEIETIEQEIFNFNDKLTEVIASKGPEYLKSVLNEPSN